mgnify:CR=1 FL=1|jgi:hypothetical protein
MKLDKLNKKMEKQFVNDAKELTAIMQDQFGDEKDFDVINYNLTLTFTVNGEERYIEMKTPFNVDDEDE